MKRESGYFWVKIDGEWHIGDYDKHRHEWWVCGFHEKFNEEELDEIDELMIPKHED